MRVGWFIGPKPETQALAQTSRLKQNMKKYFFDDLLPADPVTHW